MASMSLSAIALLAAALTVTAGDTAVQILPAGQFVGRDGRPGKDLTWKLDDASGRALAARLSAHHATVRFNFDYEHQTFTAEKNGLPAPASGWASKFEWRDGVGLFATDVQWTDRAAQMLAAGEYRYISPVMGYDKKTGLVTNVINAALVNIPALDMRPATNSVMEQLSALSLSPNLPPEQEPMTVALAILAAVGLNASATEQETVTAIVALKQRSDSVAGLNNEIVALKAATPDPAKYVSVDTVNQLNTELVALRAKEVEREVDGVIAQAKAEGKVVPAVEPIWREIGKADIAKLKSMVAATPANPALAGKQQTEGKDPGGEVGALSDAELAMCRNLGITEEQFRAGATA